MDMNFDDVDWAKWKGVEEECGFAKRSRISPNYRFIDPVKNIDREIEVAKNFDISI